MTVAWTLGTTVNNLGTLDVNQGTITDKAQTSTLTLTSAQLVKMKAVGGTHTITCKITVGVSNAVVEDTHTANLWTPGKSSEISHQQAQGLNSILRVSSSVPSFCPFSILLGLNYQ